MSKIFGWNSIQGSRELDKSLAARPVEELRRRLFIANYPEGVVYADRTREVHGDYKKLAFLSYGTLELELYPGSKPFQSLIQEHAKMLQTKRGQPYQTSTSGQGVLLGWRLPKQNPARRARRNPAAVEFRGESPRIAVYIDRSLMTTEYFPSYEAAEKAAFDHLRALHFSKEEAAREARNALRITIHSRTSGKLDRNPRSPMRGGRLANPRKHSFQRSNKKRNPATLTPRAIEVTEAVQLEPDVVRARNKLTMFHGRDSGYAEARMLARSMIGGIAEEMAAEWQKGKRLSGSWLAKKLAQKKYQRITMLDLFEAWATLTAARMDALQGTR